LSGIDTANLAAYNAENPLDPGLISLRERVEFDWQDNWPQTLCAMELELIDGRRVSARHDAGIPAAAIAAQGERLATKFDSLVSPVLGAARARELREMIAALDNLADIGSLAQLAAD